MRLYLDDNMAGRRLQGSLRKAGHDPVVPGDVGLAGASDPQHSGLLLVYYDSDPHRDMKPADIARAVSKIEAAGIALVNEATVVNHWR